MFRRILAAFAVGGVLIAATVGFAMSQTFANTGVAAQGSAAAVACEATMSVEYTQTNGEVTGVSVIQIAAANCHLAQVHVIVENDSGNLLGSGSGKVNGGPISVGVISDVEAIHHTVVTITDN